MTADKAIKVLKRRISSPFVRANTETKEATQLGIEALERETLRRAAMVFHPDDFFPSETEK